METSLKTFRDEYLETLLRFLWREWTALGVAGQEKTPLCHIVDPEAILIFTCSIGRYDPRLFDEVMDWLIKNGRFLNIQRMRNIAHREAFRGGAVLTAAADWLSQRENPMKWKLLAQMETPKNTCETLFRLHDGRPLPVSENSDPTFLTHGYCRNPIILRGRSRLFPADATPCLFLKMRALFGVNARGDVLTYLAANVTGHPREVARELYYSQKAIHDVMADMSCSGVLHSSRGGRERTYRIASGRPSFLPGGKDILRWINWPVLLSAAEIVWQKTEELHAAALDPLVESSEIILTMKPLLERLTRAGWAPAIAVADLRQGIGYLQAFQTAFETVAA